MYRPILIFFISLYISTAIVSASQVRGLWVVRYALTDESEVNEIINIAKSLDITDLYVQVRALGLSYGQEPISTKYTPLSLLVKKSKLENIRIHAWINVLYIWTGTNKPFDKKHLYYRSGTSILRTASDKNIPDYLSLKKRGIEGFFIDPSDQPNMLDIQVTISDLIQNYGVDGIHLDYLRYPSLEYSFSPNGRTTFFRENWYDPIEIFQSPNESNAALIVQKYKFNIDTYKAFLREKLTDFLIHLRNYIRQFENSIELSAAVKPDKTIADESYFQDWENWISNDICDRIVIMNYDTIMTNFKNNLNVDLGNKTNSKIIIGISTYNQDSQAVLDRIALVKNRENGGYVIFSYNYLKEHQAYLRNLKSVLSNQN